MSVTTSPLPRTPPSSRRPPKSDENLFDAPAELVCPLTLAPFVDPVLTSAGHVYERVAIEAHMERSSADPLTREPLLNKSLTPVYVLRSRALEYRESAAKACIERLCSGGVAEPARYLRRAVELVADAGGRVPGLSQETVEYVTSHPSNAFDRLALQQFASGLFQGGYRDKAAAIYSGLLLDDADRVQQAELLRRCLSCWTDGDVAAAADDHVFEKLAAIFEGRPARLTLGWDQLVDLAQAAQLGDAFVLRLCEQLLFRNVPPAVGGDDEAAMAATGGQQEKRLLLKYVHVLTGSLKRRQTETERRLAELERWQRQQRGGAGGASDQAVVAAGGWRRARVPRWARKSALAYFAICTTAVPFWHPANQMMHGILLLVLVLKD